MQAANNWKSAFLTGYSPDELNKFINSGSVHAKDIGIVRRYGATWVGCVLMACAVKAENFREQPGLAQLFRSGLKPKVRRGLSGSDTIALACRYVLGETASNAEIKSYADAVRGMHLSELPLKALESVVMERGAKTRFAILWKMDKILSDIARQSNEAPAQSPTLLALPAPQRT